MLLSHILRLLLTADSVPILRQQTDMRLSETDDLGSMSLNAAQDFSCSP